MQKYIVKIVRNLKPVLVVLFVALIGVQTLNPGALAMAQTGPKQLAALETSAQAKAVLVRMKSLNYNRIKDAGRRDALRQTIDAVKALANNTSRAREATLVANFKRALGKLKAKGRPTGAGEKCIAEDEECEKGGIWINCGLMYDMCIAAEYAELNKPGELPE